MEKWERRLEALEKEMDVIEKEMKNTINAEELKDLENMLDKASMEYNRIMQGGC